MALSWGSFARSELTRQRLDNAARICKHDGVTRRDAVFGRISRLRPKTVEHLAEVEVDGRVFLDALRCSDIRSDGGRARMTGHLMPEVLDDLASVCDVDSAAYFLRRVGLPDLCGHGLPMVHVRRDLHEGPTTFCPLPRDDSGSVLLPMRYLRNLAEVLESVRTVGADLAARRPVRDTRRLDVARRWAQVGPIGKTLEVQRRDFARVCEGLLAVAGVETAVRWTGQRPELTYRVDGLTAALLMLAVTEAVGAGRNAATVGVTTCEGCGRTIRRGRRPADSPAYCDLPTCRRAAASERQRRRRAKVRDNERGEHGER